MNWPAADEFNPSKRILIKPRYSLFQDEGKTFDSEYSAVVTPFPTPPLL